MKILREFYELITALDQNMLRYGLFMVAYQNTFMIGHAFMMLYVKEMKKKTHVGY